MLSERPEFDAVEIMNDEILIAVAPEYQQWSDENYEEYMFALLAGFIPNSG